MEAIEITDATVEQAIAKAEAQLRLSRSQFEVEVVQEGRAGILGVGSREAVIRVIPISQPGNDTVEKVSEILDTLLRLLGISGKVDIISRELPLALDITGEDLGILIGRRGQTLASLEYVMKLIVVGHLKTWIPLAIDVGGYKKRRRESLEGLAIYLAEQVKSKRRPMTMEPMPADERRIVHLTLANDPDVTTQSIDEGEHRKVVISLRQG